MRGGDEDSSPLAFEIGLLLRVALLIFIFTVVVGILNGTDLVDFDNRTILTHVHTGTLGWITTSVFAAALWLFGKGPALDRTAAAAARILTVAAVVTIPLYNLAFLRTEGELRPTAGGFVLLTILGFLVWILIRARHLELTTPHWGMLAAVVTSASGGLIGVLWGIQLATGDRMLPEGGEDAHPATMVVGFLIPVGMALAEWCLMWPRPERATRLGVAQVMGPFIGGILVVAGALLDAPPLLGLSLPFEVAGVVILLRRMWPRLRTARWMEAGKDRFAALSMGFITVNIGLFVYLIGRYQGDFDTVPEHELLALDHVMFIGVMTNSILGLLFAMSVARRDLMAWADHLIFWGINVGLTGFALGLLFDVTVLKRTFTPIMGVAILLAIVTFTMRLRTPSTTLRPAEEAPLPG